MRSPLELIAEVDNYSELSYKEKYTKFYPTFKEMFGSWTDFLRPLWSSDYMAYLIRNINKCYAEKVMYPSYDAIFRAFRECPLDKLQAVIIGGNPYPNYLATGIAYGIEEIPEIVPTSISNILYSINKDLTQVNIDEGVTEIKTTASLLNLAHQGILLLHETLMIEYQGSHGNYTLWQPFIEQVSRMISFTFPKVVFALWGDHNLKGLEGSLNPITTVISGDEPGKIDVSVKEWDFDWSELAYEIENFQVIW